MMLLQPPRSLCASTGHYPHLPSWEPVQLATARVLWSRDNFPGGTHGMPQAVATSCRPLPPQDRPTQASLPLAWLSQSPHISHSFNLLLSGWRTDPRGWPTRRGGDKSKPEPQQLCKQRREREISPCSLRSSGLNIHNKLEVPCISGIPEHTMNHPKIEVIDFGRNCRLGVCCMRLTSFWFVCLS